MREIKFRYWNGITNQMVRDPVMPHKEGWTITQLFSDRGWVWEQFTGSLDNFDTEIYEGDILRITTHINSHTTNREVEWDDDETGWFVQLGDWIAPGSYAPSIGELVEEYYVEVIGNVHENQELLEANP